MKETIPSIKIEGRNVPYIKGAFTLTGLMRAATLQFSLPLTYGGYKKLWNKEVTFFFSEDDTTPLFRGYIKRVKQDFDMIEVFAQDAFGYLLKGGGKENAKISLTNTDNLDGLTAGNAISAAINKAQLSSKISTTYIGDTTPLVSSSNPPLRGTMTVLDIIKTLISRAVDDSGDIPRPNIARLIDNGSTSELIIELRSDLDTAQIKHVFTEYDNIENLRLINKKIPTIIIVNGRNGVTGTYSHTTAMEALDRNFLEVTNELLESPAACQDFAQKIFRANLETQYQYSISSWEGAYLNENDVIRVETEDAKFGGNYRVSGKKIAFTKSTFDVAININKTPPTLLEYISQQDN
jgi:hypothetical protein|tara:strand:- start:439 stop:1491 length:1053 start_codon:yes stop_codon:yes gene_type:complete